MKDYYLILGIEPSATITEIKKAYRALAHQYHPDKNGMDPYAAARFAEIKEAYEVLTDPSKKEYYLEQRWYEQSMGRKKAQMIVTPENVLKQAIEFDRHVSRLDVHRMNKEGLFQYIKKEILSGDVIERLNVFGVKEINKEIISFFLKTLYVIPSDRLKEMEKMLLSINTDPTTQEISSIAFDKVRKERKSEKNQIWILLFIVVVIILVIYFAGR